MTVLTPGEETARGRFARHASDLLRLALPVIASRAGMVVLVAVDSVILGHIDADQLAYFGLGQSVCIPLIGALLGLLLGASALTSHALGAGRDRGCGAIFRQAVPYALLVGGLAALFCGCGPWLLPWLGQSPEMTAGAAPALAVLGLGFPGMALQLAVTSFFEGLKRPMPGLMVMIAGNLLNLVLCWILSRGMFGLPFQGAIGAAWATTIARTAMGAALFALAWWMRDRDRWGVRDGFRGAFREGRDFRRFGYAAGLSMGIENVAFSGLGVMAGIISAPAMASYTVLLNLLALPFMAAAGVAAATGVRVGVGFGAGSRREIAWAGWSGLSLSTLLLSPAVALYAACPDLVAAMYTPDAALLELLIPTVAFSASILIADGSQVVMANALRGRNDRWIPTVLHFISYFAVMVPSCGILAFVFDRGLLGIMEGILIASAFSASALTLRFAWLGRVEPARAG